MSIAQEVTTAPPLLQIVARDGPRWHYTACPFCASSDITTYRRLTNPGGYKDFTRCLDCGAHLGYEDSIHDHIKAQLNRLFLAVTAREEAYP